MSRGSFWPRRDVGAKPTAARCFECIPLLGGGGSGAREIENGFVVLGNQSGRGGDFGGRKRVGENRETGSFKIKWTDKKV